MSAREPEERRYPWWLLTLAALGVVALLGAVITLFFTLGRRPERFEVTEAPAADSVDFLRSVAGAAGAPLRSGGSVRLLENGAFYPALLEAIASATRTINISVYIWEPGKACDAVFGALVERARAGVEVRVLLDGFGGLRTPQQWVEALRAAGGRVESFRSPRLGKFTRFHKRNHRRANVMDGTRGFTGGAAIADKWLGDARNPQEWRDVMVEVVGPPAATLQSAFVAMWAHSTGEILSGPDMFPPASDAAALPRGEHVISHVGVAIRSGRPPMRASTATAIRRMPPKRPGRGSTSLRSRSIAPRASTALPKSLPSLTAAG
jgi:cardiolipin synthase